MIFLVSGKFYLKVNQVVEGVLECMNLEDRRYSFCSMKIKAI